MSAFAVGVDAGGTATAALASHDGERGRLVRGDPGNPSSLGIARAAEAIAAAVREAAGGNEPAALYVGAAGAANPVTASALEGSLRREFPAARLTVRSDAECALRAAIPEGPGAVLIAGTGSSAYAERGERRERTGGYGYLAGDEGSAFWIGLSAVKLLARSYDGRGPRDETAALAERTLGCTDRDGLVAALYAQPLDVAKIASLAPSVIAFAGKGNRAATKIVQAAAQELGDLVRAVARACGLVEESPRIALGGGLLRENSLLSFLLESRIASELPGAEIVRVRVEPVEAALRFAEALLA